jgi:predicted O-linked N-acetylglucosamine transferase (SPINDLY family)
MNKLNEKRENEQEIMIKNEILLCEEKWKYIETCLNTSNTVNLNVDLQELQTLIQPIITKICLQENGNIKKKEYSAVIFLIYAKLYVLLSGGIDLNKKTLLDNEKKLLQESISSLKIVLECDPFHLEAIELIKLISVFYAVKIQDKKESLALLKSIIVYDPHDFQVNFNLGLFYQLNNDLDNSLYNFKLCASILQNKLQNLNEKEMKNEFNILLSKTYNSIGSLYFFAQNRETALIYYNKALEYNQNDQDIFNQLGVVYTELRFVDKALENYNKAIKIGNELVEKNGLTNDLKNFLSSVYMNRGLAICYECDYINAIESYNTALKYNPRLSLAFQNKLLDINYISHLIPDKMYISNLHKKINNIYPKVITNWKESLPDYKIKQLPATYSEFKQIANAPKIRIGFVSGDYICHPVSYFLNTILTNFNDNLFEVYCYSLKIMELSNVYPKCKIQIVKNYSNTEFADLIKNDKIDILFDMSAHTGDNRLDTFALKPAPIQISYCGYPGTSGLNSIDYHFTDKYCNSENTRKYYSEKLIFLKHCFLNYTPPMGKNDILPFPDNLQQPFIQNNRKITFGTFNRLNKINNYVIKTWVELLSKIPNSQFIIKTKEFLTPHLLQKFKNSINQYETELQLQPNTVLDKIIFLDYGETLLDHLPNYNFIDIALDTFPYSGTTTSCEALYMGVPIITFYDKEKEFHSQNVTTSLLINSNLNEYITYSTDEYINKAIEFSQKDSTFFKNLKQNTRNSFLNGYVWQIEPFLDNFQETLYNIYTTHFH